MSSKEKQVQELLNERGFRLIRQTKHKVYRDRCGRTITRSSTPSDVRADHRVLQDLKRVLRPAEPDTTVDATLPKAQKKSGGSAGVGNLGFNFYEGFAPRSIPATPEAKLIELRGHLAAKRAYEFKSLLVQEFMRGADTGVMNWQRDAQTAIARFMDLAKIIMKAINETEGEITEDGVEDSLRGPLKVLKYQIEFYAENVEQMPESDSTGPLEMLTFIHRHLSAQLQESLSARGLAWRRRQKDLIREIARKAANRIQKRLPLDELEQFLQSENARARKLGVRGMGAFLKVIERFATELSDEVKDASSSEQAKNN